VVYPPIAKRFYYFDNEFLKKKRRKHDLDYFWLLDFLGYWILYLSFTIFTCNLAILAALDSNLVANLGLRKYSPSFICTTAACKSKLSRVGVWRCTAVVGGYHSWTTKGVTDVKHWNVKNLKHEKSGKPISIQVDLQFFGKVNIAAVIDSGYKLLLEKHNNTVKKNNNFVENHKLFEIFWKI